MIVYNSEPLGYSVKAANSWVDKGYLYIAGSWEEIDSKTNFPEIEILIVRLSRKIGQEILIKFPNLKYIVSATTGLDHLDLTYLQKTGIELVSLKGQDTFLETIPSTAEYTWALLLSLARNIPAANESVKKGEWLRDLYRGYQLKNKTIGIVGYGRIGKKVARYARAFDMNVTYYDPHVDNAEDEKITSLELLMEQADILTYHVHLNSTTEHLLNESNKHHLKKDVFLLNTSRGKIWDEKVVAEGLYAKRIKGAAADVLEHELDDVKNSHLWQAQQKGFNVILSPHIGGATWDAMWDCEEYISGLIKQRS